MIPKLKIENWKLKIPAKQAGFTLVELLIAVSLFIVVVTISIGAILSIFDANRKAQSSKTVVDNLNLSIESMARTVRFGGFYYCGVSSNLSSVNNCTAGGNAISVTFESKRIIYSWSGISGAPIRRSDNGGVTYVDITSPDTKIEYLRFYVFNTTDLIPGSDANQPYAIAVIKGYVGEKPTSKTTFSIETLMSQRTLDL